MFRSSGPSAENRILQRWHEIAIGLYTAPGRFYKISHRPPPGSVPGPFRRIGFPPLIITFPPAYSRLRVLWRPKIMRSTRRSETIWSPPRAPQHRINIYTYTNITEDDRYMIILL